MIPAQTPQQLTPQQVFEQAKRLLVMGDFHDASQRAALLRSHFPEDTPILALHGLCMGAIGLHELAVEDLARAADDTARALAEADAANPSRPRMADQLLRVLAQLARSQEALGNHAGADASLERALAVDPEDPHATRARVEILAARGDTDAARTFLSEADTLGLEELPSAMSAAAIALARTDATHEEFHVLAQRLRALTEQVGLDAATQADALRRVTRLFDRAGEHDEAFRAATRAANFTRGSYDAASHAKVTNVVLSNWTAEAMGKLTRPQRDDSNIAFVFGPPCSGALELARALTSHPQVACTGPSEVLTLAAVRHAGAKGTPHRPVLPNPANLRGQQLDAVANLYTTHAARNAQPKGRPFIADPAYLHGHLLGLAALAMPGARFVLVRRDPRALVLDCYFEPLAGHHPFKKELATTAAYLRDIDRLMDHWSQVLPTLGCTVIETTRERLADPGEIARIAAALGLPADAALHAPRFEPSPADHPDRYTKRLEQVAQLIPPSKAAH